MRWLTKLLFALLLLSGIAFSQAYTSVTGTAKDSAGNLYVNCTFSVNFVGQSSLPGPYLLFGSTFQQSYAGVRCDGFGVFSLTLPSNIAIQPQPSSWSFNFCDSSGHFCNGQNTAVLTIAGATQDITTQITAVLPTLPSAAGVTSFNGRAGVVVPQAADYSAFYAPITGGGGWNPPNAPANTLFGNNTIATSTPAFFIPGGDTSFSAGNFSVNRLHFGSTALSLTPTGITTGNCLQISGSTIIGAGCAAGSVGTGTINTMAKYASTNSITSSLATDNGSTLSYTGTGGVASPQFSGVGTGGYLLTSPTFALPSSTGGPGQNAFVSGPDGWYYSNANGAWQPLGGGAVSSVFGRTGTVTSALNDYNFNQIAGTVSPAQLPATGLVTSFNTRSGSVTPQNGDYNFSQITGTLSSTQIGTAAVTTFNGRSGVVSPASGDYNVTQVTNAASLASPGFTGVPTGPTATQGTNTNQLATTAFVIANAGGGGGSLNPPASLSNFTPACATANTGGNTTFNGTVTANDTVFVGISVAATTPSAAFTVTDTGGTNYSQLISANTATAHTSLLFASTVNGASASSSVTVRWTGSLKYVACVVAYKNVGSLGSPAPTSNNTPGLTGSVNVTTTQANTIVFGFIGGNAVVTTFAPLTGTLLASQNTSAGNGANGAICSNTSSTTGTVGCSVTYGSNSAYDGFAIELHNVLGVASVFGRTGAVAAATGDYNFSQISGTLANAQLPTSGLVTSFNTRSGSILPQSGDYNFNQLAGTIATSQIGSSAVTSWNGQTGVVVPNTGDYTVAQVTGAAPLTSPNFAGVPTAPTAAPGTSNTQIATTQFVLANIPPAPVTSFNGRTGAVVPATNDYTVAQVNGAAPLASPSLSGTPTAPTALTADSSTTIATTGFVKGYLGGGWGGAPLTSITHSTQVPVCAAQSDGTQLSLTVSPLNILIGDTVLVEIQIYGNATTQPDITSTLSDSSGGANTYTLLRHVSPNVGFNSGARSAWGVLSMTAAASYIVVTNSQASKFAVCVTTYKGVLAFGQTQISEPTSTGYPSGAPATISITTTDANNVLAALWGAPTSIVNASIQSGGGAEQARIQTTGVAPTVGVISCENSSSSPQIVSCVVGATTGNIFWNGLAVELRCCAGFTGGGTASFFPRVVAYRLFNVSDTSMVSTPLCTAANCPVGFYRLEFTILTLGAGCTGGTVIPNLIYTNEVGPQNIPLLTTGAPFTAGNIAYGTRPFQNAGTASVNVSTTAVACTSGGPASGHMYMTVERLQ